MTVGIIGGAGFVGARLASVMNEANIAYKLFDKVLDGPNYVDITRQETFEALPQLETVINLAAEHRDDVTPSSLYDLVNVEGSRNVCDFCRERNIHNIIFTSSVAVYGFAPEGTDETGAINYFNDYGRTKYQAEKVYQAWYEEDPKNRTLIILRPTVIFGEGNRGNVYNLMKQIAERRFLMVGDGKNKKSMAYVENVAQALHHVSKLKGFHLYNYVDSPDLTIAQLVSQIRGELFDKNNVGATIPYWAGLIIGRIFDAIAVITKKQFPISAIRVNKFVSTTSFTSRIRDCGFEGKVTIQEGLKSTLKSDIERFVGSRKTGN